VIPPWWRHHPRALPETAATEAILLREAENQKAAAAELRGLADVVRRLAVTDGGEGGVTTDG
jgi:hypothetical protein